LAVTDAAGIVHLVGAGPGDPGLLTRRGEQLLREADVVVYDRLVSAELLELCRPEAERVFVGKEGFGPSVPQAATNRLLIERARAGQRVVRLKGGDPFVFGRGGEEALELVAAGVAYEVVPGVSSAIAGPACAGIPVTQRGLASSFTVATGNEDPTKPESAIDWPALARGADTLVLLMGVERLAAIAERLIGAGRSADEPTALIRWATTPGQQTVLATLGSIAERTAERGIRPPAVLVVGAVVGLAERLGRPRGGPLAGRRVLVTRARQQASALSARLRSLGAEPLEFPSIGIEMLTDTAELDRALGNLAEFDWVVLTSVNGVQACFEGLQRLERDARAFGSARVAAIGPATERELRQRGIRPDLVPGVFTSEGVSAALGPLLSASSRVLLPRADIAPPALAEALAATGARVESVTAYRTVPERAGRETVRRLLERGEIDVVTFTSSSTVGNLVEGLEGAAALLARPLVACIGPVTAATARRLGLEVDLVAETHTIDGLIAALVARLAPDPSHAPQEVAR
jgi:uroporphyrinogen III methyltransferase/synthase